MISTNVSLSSATIFRFGVPVVFVLPRLFCSKDRLVMGSSWAAHFFRMLLGICDLNGSDDLRSWVLKLFLLDDFSALIAGVGEHLQSQKV